MKVDREVIALFVNSVTCGAGSSPGASAPSNTLTYHTLERIAAAVQA